MLVVDLVVDVGVVDLVVDVGVVDLVVDVGVVERLDGLVDFITSVPRFRTIGVTIVRVEVGITVDASDLTGIAVVTNPLGPSTVYAKSSISIRLDNVPTGVFAGL